MEDFWDLLWDLGIGMGWRFGGFYFTAMLVISFLGWFFLSFLRGSHFILWLCDSGREITKEMEQKLHCRGGNKRPGLRKTQELLLLASPKLYVPNYILSCNNRAWKRIYCKPLYEASVIAVLAGWWYLKDHQWAIWSLTELRCHQIKIHDTMELQDIMTFLPLNKSCLC